MRHDPIGLMAVLVWVVLPSLGQFEVAGMGRGWDLVIAKGGLLGCPVGMVLPISEGWLSSAKGRHRDPLPALRLLYSDSKNQFEIDLPLPLFG